MRRFYQYNVEVAANFDLNLLPLYRVQGQLMPHLPGLLVTPPPRRTARGRENDHLLVFLTLSGNLNFTFSDYKQVISRTAQRFYQTAGSVTSAIRTTAGELNQSLVKRNLRTSKKGEYIVGRLIMGVLRGPQLLLAQFGPSHIFHLTESEARQIHDEQIAGRGLGFGQATTIHFNQIDLHEGDLLVFSPSLPTGWGALPGERHATFETLQRKLPALTSDDLNAVLVQVQAGKGNLNLLEGLPGAASAAAPATPAGGRPEVPAQEIAPGTHQAALPTAATVPAPPPMPTSQVASGRPASRFSRLLAGEEKPSPPASPSGPETPPKSTEFLNAPLGKVTRMTPAAPVPRPAPAPARSVVSPTRRRGLFVAPRSDGTFPEIKRPPSPARRAFFSGLARLIQGTRAGTQSVSRTFRKFLPNLVPSEGERPETSGSGIALFAIVIPVIIVAIAMTVYFHYGRTAQYQQYYEMALSQASQARGQTDPTEVRRLWDSTIYYLDLAEKNLRTQDSTSLRQEAQTALDNLDGILRLDFRPAIPGGLSSSVQITHLAATDTDLYLLDAARGAVLRAFVTSQGYEVDPTFKCEPGEYGSVIVGGLVDLEALPMSNTYNARILAMDGKGNLLYCGPAEPAAVALVPPQLGWRGISAFSLDADGKDLYVLDPAANAVWQYTGSFGQFQDMPVMFFGEQVPQDMHDAIDLTANNSDLYLLFQDGHVSACPLTRFEGVPMRCTDPATFVDNRPERKPGPKINDAIFTQISFATAPDPSLYLLEPLTRAIYRFSPRADSLELRGQFRASMQVNNTLFNDPAAAMTISPNRYAFLSVGNQVYFATDVP